MSNKQEEAYFAKEDAKKLAEIRAKKAADLAALEKQAQRELHYHKCGKCGEHMETKPYRGVEIEVCPSCGAVLLDPGELELLAGEDGGILSDMYAFFKRS